jgi:predicted dehydrogenase
MPERIKIAQLGIGHLHAYKIKTIRDYPDVFDLVGIAEDDPKQRAEFGGQECYRGLKWMGEAELLAVPGLQAVLVEKEEHDTVSTALRCIQAGKHIHCDKPGGESLPPFKQLLDEAKKRNLTVQMGYMYRNNNAVEFCIKAVREGLLGNIFEIDAVMNRFDGEDFRKLMKTFKAGAPYIFTCHLIDLVVILLGKPDRITPFISRTRPDGAVDNGLAVFEYPNGCIATVRSGITEVEGFARRHLSVCGDKGTIVIQPLEIVGDNSGGKLRMALAEDRDGWKKGYQEVDLPPARFRYDDQLLEFAKIVRGEIANPYSYEHDLLVQDCVLKACGL